MFESQGNATAENALFSHMENVFVGELVTLLHAPAVKIEQPFPKWLPVL